MGVSINNCSIKYDIEWTNTLVEENNTNCERKLLEQIFSLKQCGGCLTITKTEDDVLIHLFPVSTDFKEVFNQTEPTVCALFCYECAIQKIGSERHRGVAKIKQPWMLVQHLKTHNKEFTCQACTQVALTGRSFSVISELARHLRQKSCVQNHSDYTKLLRRRNKKTFHDSRRLRE